MEGWRDGRREGRRGQPYMNKVDKDWIEVGECSSSLHIKAELLFKVSPKADLEEEEEEEINRSPMLANTAGLVITFCRKSQISWPICLRSSTRLRALWGGRHSLTTTIPPVRVRDSVPHLSESCAVLHRYISALTINGSLVSSD